MAGLKITALTKQFGAVRAVDDISFTVADGEFLTLLGPSGCGKSTTLGAIAGLDRPDRGRIELGERCFFDSARRLFVEPEGRDIGLVFQSYALWPHMTVRHNLEFPLKLRKVSRAERARRIEEILDLVEMTAYVERYPHELSGGQQQRVALARTLIYRPGLLLLDEPLSNLDAKLRERARVWLRQLQTRIGVTTLYVTHDQNEALALSDRIAVMNGGRIVQLAEPRTVYQFPSDSFVADFIGSSNFFSGRVRAVEDDLCRVAIGDRSTLSARSAHALKAGDPVTVAIRPERIAIREGRAAEDAAAGGAANVFRVEVSNMSFLGARTMVFSEIEGSSFRIECDWAPDASSILVEMPEEACMIFPAAEGPEQRALQ